MKEKDLEGCFELFSRIIGELKTPVESGGVYSDPLVMWLMIYQRLNEGASLARALDQFAAEDCWKLAGKCKRSQERKLSTNTGGYSQARANLSPRLVEATADHFYSWMRGPTANNLEDRLYGLDGSTVELLRSDDLLKRFPSHSKRGHFPLMRILAFHHLKTGLALRPEYGAMYGKYRKGEIQLFKAMSGRLPSDAIIVADRNFGIYAVAYVAQRAGLDVILRLQEHRAKKILGKKPKHGIDRKVEWSASARDLRNNRELPRDVTLTGRVVCVNVSPGPGFKKVPLFLYTTLDVTPKKLAELYGWRWDVETDLNTLKRTVNMHMLKVNSEDMAKKELIIGVCAYNLVRAVIKTVALEFGKDPRDFSFKRILYAVDSCASAYNRATSTKEKDRILKFFRSTAKSAQHPKRKKRRVEPRALVRNRRQKYPSLNGTRKQVRQARKKGRSHLSGLFRFDL